MTSCDKKQVEAGADFPPDPETARIEGELRLMNLSRDAKTHALTFCDENAFMKSEDVPAQAIQIHEKTFYLCPVAHHPRFLLVGKIRVEVCREIKDYDHSKVSPGTSDDISQNSDSNPQ